MSRLVNRQRQMAEQGRLRFGYLPPGSKYPKTTTKWIVTSHSESHVRAAAELWGGEVHRWQPQGNGAEQWRVMTDTNVIEGILPPGDPLTIAYEMWSRGGCQRRCDGATEQLSGDPCICRAEFGETYYEQDAGVVCGEKSRLKLLLPDMPGMGTWRMETGSFYAADEVAGVVDTIRGAVGDRALVWVRIHLEQRTRVKNGKTSHFVVPVINPLGTTLRELLAGDVSTLEVGATDPRPAVGGRQQAAVTGGRAAIEGPPSRDFVAEIKAAKTKDDVLAVWQAAKDAQAPNGAEIQAAAKARAAELDQAAAPVVPAEDAREKHIKAALSATSLEALSAALAEAQAEGFCRNLEDDSDDLVAAFVGRRRALDALAPVEPAGDRDALWQQVVAAWPGDTLSELETALESAYDVKPGEASADQLARFLADIKADTVQPANAGAGVSF